MATSECTEKWSNVNTCIFIDLYKERPYLWNPKHLQYKNKLIRFDGLTEIGNIMKISVEECEKKIKNLLSQYAREKKRNQENKKSGAGASTAKNIWFAYEQMHFLQDRNKPMHTRDTGEEETTSAVLVSIF
ncbi:unnamed protein product [Macrosiphum euphorbiae]|uniref:MADF domain-containing protein n=1 Tax=Macrosiphum euphorbiae TaxID=13131 RepID=A0AAV0XSD5_9HEMI|nr:unnamed protein product [Macrosiphum euphorbiae]